MPIQKQKQSPTFRRKYGSNRGELELREAIAFLFLVKGPGKLPYIPSVDEFFSHCGVVLASLREKEKRKRATSMDAFLNHVIPSLQSKDTVDSAFQCLAVVQNALLVQSYSRIYLEQVSEGREEIQKVLESVEFEVPLGWFFRTIFPVFCIGQEKRPADVATKLQQVHIVGIAENILIPELLTNPLSIAMEVSAAVDAATAAIEKTKETYYIPFLRILEKNLERK